MPAQAWQTAGLDSAVRLCLQSIAVTNDYNALQQASLEFAREPELSHACCMQEQMPGNEVAVAICKFKLSCSAGLTRVNKHSSSAADGASALKIALQAAIFI